jgi:CAAX prenyl protease-like protein
MASPHKGTGWAPYWFPMLAFLLLVEVAGRAPDGAAGFLLALRVVLPGALVLWYWRRGDYPELRGLRLDGMLALDVAVGLLGAALWIAPFLLWDGLPPDSLGFDPNRAFGPDGAWLALTLRGVGYAAVTPFVEELFVRSWLIRYADVFDVRSDFRDVPIARFTWRSFLVVLVYFVFTHATWEYGVMLAWSLLTLGWFYYRKHLLPLVLVHAVTNGAIFAFVLLCDGSFRDAAGNPIPLWFLL